MDNIINLLKDKNEHLRKFKQLNESELANFSEGNFDNLEIFYNSRETILDLIRCIDGLIDVSLNESDLETMPAAEEDRARIVQILGQRNDLVTEILAQDLQILSVIEQTKSDIIKELRQVQSARKAVGAYKSGSMSNQLDEKA
jgi:hypothetical protein